MSREAVKYTPENRLDGIRKLINEGLADYISELSAHNPLAQAVAYVINSGGKRTRPLIALSLFTDLGHNPRDLISSAVSLELLHLASLIHDDLPALDNDNMRRGFKTCHVQFNEATAILAGDYLVSQSICLAQKTGLEGKIVLKISEILSKAFSDLCLGQQIDLNPAGDINDRINLARLKTGSLFSASVLIPFIAADYETNILKDAEMLGIHIGVLYQIFDDLADSSDPANVKGREDSSDTRNNKTTFNSCNNQEMENLIIKTSDEVFRLISEIEKNTGPGLSLINFRDCLNLLFSPFKHILPQH